MCLSRPLRYMTRQEQKRQEHPNLAYNVMGYVACTLWPLVGLAIFLSAHSRPASFSPAELD